MSAEFRPADMPEDRRSIKVPQEFAADVSILVEELQAIADDTSDFKKEEVLLIKPNSHRLDVGALATPILVVSGHALVWLAKEWFGENVSKIARPKLRKLLENKSFQKWLRTALRDIK